MKPSPMKIFKVAAYGDKVYIQAKTKEDAKKRLFDVMGAIPEELLSFSEISKLPKGEEFL
jgi:hypothetical protein